MTWHPTIFLCAASLFLSILASQAATLKSGGLKCEYRVNPLGLDTAQAPPQLAARIQGTRPAANAPTRSSRRRASDLLAKGTGDLWDSGKVASAESVAGGLRRPAAAVGPAGLLEGARLGPRGIGPRLTARRHGGRWACWRRRIGRRRGLPASGQRRGRSSRCSRMTRRRCSGRSLRSPRRSAAPGSMSAGWATTSCA